MSKLLRAFLITAAATGAAALLLKVLDLDGAPVPGDEEPGFPGLDPENLSEEDVDALMNELAGQLNL